MRRPHSIQRVSERGAAALGIALVLLATMTLIVLFANRSLLFEQRASANQYRAAQAYEAAEAGLDWALALLNDPRGIDTSCRPVAGTSDSFRARYAPVAGGAMPTDGTLVLAPMVGVRPACRLVGDGLACACPANGPVVGLEGAEPSFSLEFSTVDTDGESLRVVARGCSTGAAPCVSAARQADATTTLAVTLKLRAGLRSAPTAALTAGGNVALDSGVTVANTLRETQGLLVDAGGRVDGQAQLVTLPGSPPANALVPADAALGRLAGADASGEALFSAWFGATQAQFRAAPVVKTISGCSPSACGDALRAAVADGYRSFFVDTALQLDGLAWPDAEVGRADQPLLIVTTGSVSLAPGTRVHGLFYGDATQWRIEGNGAVQGAAAARGHLQVANGIRIEYEADRLRLLRLPAGVFARVPGSWRDGRCLDGEPSTACRLEP